MTQEIVRGGYHSVRMRCDYCHQVPRLPRTLVVNGGPITGRFCDSEHMRLAYDQMRKANPELPDLETLHE